MRMKVPFTAAWGGRLLLTALFLDLAGTKWASYLPTPVAGLYLPDALLGTSAVLGFLAMVTRYRIERLGRALLAALPVWSYVIYRVVSAPTLPPPNASLWLRDMAPFLYIALIPLLVPAVHGITFRTLLRTVRAASVFMGLVVAGLLSGLVSPVSIGTEIPLFSGRPDVDNTVLGLGIIAFGGWGAHGRPHRLIQLALMSLAAANYSRSGLLAAGVCVLAAALHERREILRSQSVAPVMVMGSALGLLILLWPPNLPSPTPVRSPEAVERLLRSDVDTGTTAARMRAWDRMIQYTRVHEHIMLGSGPASQPVLASGAVEYLSGSKDVRAPHSWFVGVFAYHGLVGLGAWVFAFFVIFRRWRRTPYAILPVAGIAAYTVSGAFGVVIESPFGSLPMAALGAWLLAHTSGYEPKRP